MARPSLQPTPNLLSMIFRDAFRTLLIRLRTVSQTTASEKRLPKTKRECVSSDKSDKNDGNDNVDSIKCQKSRRAKQMPTQKFRWGDFLVELRLTIIRRRKTAANLIYRFFSLLAVCVSIVTFHLNNWRRESWVLCRSYLVVVCFLFFFFQRKKICRQAPLIIHQEFMNALKQSHSESIVINYFTSLPGGFIGRTSKNTTRFWNIQCLLSSPLVFE